MANMKLDLAHLVSRSGKKSKEVSILTLENGVNIVFSGVVSQEQALSSALGLVSNSLSGQKPVVRRKRRRSKARKIVRRTRRNKRLGRPPGRVARRGPGRPPKAETTAPAVA